MRMKVGLKITTVNYISLKFTAFSLLLFCSLNSQAQNNKIQRVILDWDFFVNDKPLNTIDDAAVRTNLIFGFKIKNQVGDKVSLTFTFNVIADTAKSFFSFKHKYKNLVLLKHEQGHADITVIFANKLKQALTTKTFYKKTYKSDIEKISKEIYNLMHLTQVTYDNETGHGKISQKQLEWNKYFIRELDIK